MKDGTLKLPAINFNHTNANADNFQITAGTPGTANSGFTIRDIDASANRLVINTDGNVGVGTDTPSQKLHVSSSDHTRVLVTAGTDKYAELQFENDAQKFAMGVQNDDKFFMYNNTGSSSVFEVDTSSNIIFKKIVGIGDSTLSTYHTSYPALELGASASVQGYTGNNGVWLQSNLFMNTNGQWTSKSNDFSAMLELYDGNFHFYNTASGTGTRTLLTPMAIKQSGKVGIGTNSPDWKFTVEGSANDDWISRIYNTNTNGSGTLIRTDATSANDKIALGVYADGGYKMLVRSTGNVGIGETSPENILHIKTSAAGGPQIELDSTSGTANSAFINFDGTSLQLATQRDMVDGSKRDTAKSWGGINIIGAAAGSYIQLQTSEGNNNAVSTKMEISKEGYVTKPSTPMFSYLGSKSHSIITTGTQTMSSSNVWSASVNHAFNNGSHFNASNGRFTAPVAGKYHFQFQCMASNFGSGYLWFYMNINNTTKSYFQMTQQTDHNAMVHHMYCDLAASDYVTCQWTNNYVSGIIHYPGFSGSLVG